MIALALPTFHPSRPRARHYQTRVPEAGALVVTLCHGPTAWETRIEGGRLDGWTLPAGSRHEAGIIHRGAVTLAREAAAGTEPGKR